MATIHYVAWRLVREPWLRVLIGAHTQELAELFSRRVRRLVRRFVALNREKTSAAEWETEAGGGLRAAGVGTAIAGIGAELIVIDDPVRSRKEADSRVYRDRVGQWYTDDLSTRQQPGCAIVLIQTRWHEDDLAGRLLQSESGSEWRVLRMPAFAETQQERDAWAERLGRPLGLPDPLNREPGAPLWPAEWDTPALLRQQRLQGGSFQALYQQNPLPASGGLFRRSWFRISDRAPGGIRFARFWDCAAKASERSDYTVGALVGRVSVLDGRRETGDGRTGQEGSGKRGDGRGEIGGLVIADVVRGRWEYPEMKRVILQTALLDGPGVLIGIEESANGNAILQDLRRDPAAARLMIRGVRVSADKGVRAGAWASLAEGGLVSLVKGEWNRAFLDEAASFPLGGHDDQIDAVSGAYELILSKPALFSTEEGERGRWYRILPKRREWE